jgi:hypothetical protein
MAPAKSEANLATKTNMSKSLFLNQILTGLFTMTIILNIDYQLFILISAFIRKVG